MSGFKFVLLLMSLIILLVFFQYHLWLKKNGIPEMLQLKKTLNIQLSKNEKLKKRNEELILQIQRMQDSEDATESRARNELGMVKKGETFYQIVQ